MARQDKEYEQFVQNVYQKVIEAEGHDTVKVEHNIRLEGISGQKHQIDVYWEYRQGGITYKTAIECKYYKRKINIGKVRDFHGVLCDIPNLRGIMATKTDYTSGAKRFAKTHGIDLHVIRESERRDYLPPINVYVPRIIRQEPLIIGFDPNWHEVELAKTIDSYSGKIELHEMLLEDRRTGNTRTVASLEEELDFGGLGAGQIRTQVFPNSKEVFEEIWLHFPNGCHVPPIKIRQLSVSYRLEKTFRLEPVIRSDDVVVLSSREDTYIVYSKNGKKVGVKARGVKLDELQLDELELD